jgi:hypothetical protein
MCRGFQVFASGKKAYLQALKARLIHDMNGTAEDVPFPSLPKH